MNALEIAVRTLMKSVDDLVAEYYLTDDPQEKQEIVDNALAILDRAIEITKDRVEG